MEIEIQKQKDIPLLNRQRVILLVVYDGGATPSILQFKELISSKLKVNKDLIAIRHVYQHYGFPQAKVIAHIYKTRADLLHLEKLKKGERKTLEVAKKLVDERTKADALTKKAAPKEDLE